MGQGLLLRARRVGDVDRLLADAAAARRTSAVAGSATLSAGVGG